MIIEYEKYYALDTNIILNNIENVARFSQEGKNLVIVAEPVIFELDDKKGDIHDDVGYQSREFQRFLRDAKIISKNINGLKEVIVEGKISGMKCRVAMIALKEYENKPFFAKMEMDKYIVETYKKYEQLYLKKINKEMAFISNDTYARTLALFEGLEVEDMRPQVKINTDIPIYKEIEYKGRIKDINGVNIKKIDKNFTHGTYSYGIEKQGRSYYGIVSDMKFNELKDSDFNGMNIKPKNLEQRLYTKAILDETIDIVVCDSLAGTGKTLMAFSAAMRLMNQGLYDGIVYIRNSINSVEQNAEIGFLSTNEGKMEPYKGAMDTSLEKIVKHMNLKKNKKNNIENQNTIEQQIEQLKEKYNIQFEWPGSARGKTYFNVIIILDEWQNSSLNTSKLIVSRPDMNCKLIVIGSNTQIDNTYLTPYSNGLSRLIKESQNDPEVVKEKFLKEHNRELDELILFNTKLLKSERGKYAEFSERVF